MSVTLSEAIKAFSAGGTRGHIDVTVTGTNEGDEPVLNASGSLGFLLQDSTGNYVASLHRIPPLGPDMGGPVNRGETFERSISFDTGPVDLGSEYVLTCRHLLTGDYTVSTFTFTPLSLGTPGAAPFVA